MYDFDVVVIGAGHAGIEASTAVARIGLKVALITQQETDIGALSCNPSIGGLGKTQLISEIDAFGGIMPYVADLSSIHWRLLNSTHGAATQALRAQVDRKLYSQNMLSILNKYKNLSIIYESVYDLDLNNKIVNNKILSKAIVITTGTFLNGLIHMGEDRIESGRILEDNKYQKSDKNISKILTEAGFPIIRLKTGTPARLYKDSIKYNMCEIQESDKEHDFFSGLTNINLNNKTINCYITKTNEKIHNFIKDNIKYAPMYNGNITGTGPRYCPSLEDKVMKFPNHNSHHVFLEPEGLESNLVYPNGISTSFSKELQDKWIRMINGLENVEIARYGYAIEYDSIDPRMIKSTLESKDIPGLFFAGQINGTSGYEEAASQGLVAGANAAIYCLNSNKYLNLDRTNSMIGVMINDITTIGINEPYRMFTSRSEYRLSLRSDNAIERLGKIALDLNLITKEEFDIKYSKKINIIKDNDLIYSGYIDRNKREIENYNKDKNIKIPEKFQYTNIPGLTNELVEKLSFTRPETIADLSKIPGITPAGIMVVLRKIKLEKYNRLS